MSVALGATERTVNRVAALIRIATNGSVSESEARDAALSACLLISEHGMAISSVPEPRLAAELRYISSVPEPRPANGAPPEPPPPAPEKGPDKDGAAKPPRRIVAKFPGYCEGCDGSILVGEHCLWQKGLTWHMDCV